MFLTKLETEQSFKATIDELRRRCLNNDQRLMPEQLPEKLSVGKAAWLIKSTKQKTTDLDETAIKKVDRIHSNISTMYYEGVNGIEKADIAHDFEGKAYWDFIITREALTEYIKKDTDHKEILVSRDVLITSFATEERPMGSANHTNIYITQNNVDAQFTKNENLHVDARTYNKKYSYHEAPERSSPAQSAKSKSSRTDVLSEALSREIFPALKKDGHKISAGIDFAKLCWEKLSDALKAIGCTEVDVAILGSECDQDSHEFHAKHKTLQMPSKNFKSFRQRISRMANK